MSILSIIVLCVLGLSLQAQNKKSIVVVGYNLYESETIDGLQKMTVIKAEFSHYLKQLISDMVFSSISHSIKGSGKPVDNALAKLIDAIRSSDSRYKSFIEKGKKKILRYFNENSNQFITKSNALLQMQKYGEAFLELIKVTVQAESCYEDTGQQMLVIYKSFQKNNCQRIVQKGKVAIASQQYDDILNYLSSADPDTPCFEQASTLIKPIKNHINEMELRN